LVKKIDQATTANQDCHMGSFVVLLSDDEGLEKKLKELAKKEKLKDVVLTIETNTAGPASWKIAKDADVTVVLYTKHKVMANYAFKKGELKSADVDKIVGDVKKILPEK
jgi:predicted transcriptional regulator